MPTRTYYFPENFEHLEEILRAEPNRFPKEELPRCREYTVAPLPSVGSLPLLLGISPRIIFSIRLKTRKHYRSFCLKKKDGTPRKIDTPRTYLKVIQWWILDNILSRIKIADNVFGFVARRSAIQNAEFHFKKAHVLNVDIKQFFPSITIKQVRTVFCSLGYRKEVANMLAELCCLDERVPQGAPTSPALANLVLRSLDKELLRLASQAGLKYSRYADDLTFSSSEHIQDEFLKIVQTTVKREGFNLNPEKTRFSGMEGRMEVTGVVINEIMQPSRVWRKRTRAALHQLGKSRRLTRKTRSYLFGIKGMAKQFQGSPQMQRLSCDAEKLIETKSQTVIGKGARPILPKRLTLRQAEVLAALAPRRTNIEIAMRLKTTEATVNKRLQEAFKKINVVNRSEALAWATHNL